MPKSLTRTTKHGGARIGAGRKPKPLTVLRRRIMAEKQEDAERAYALFVGVMDDNAQTITLRMTAAQEVMNRVLGKAQQPIEQDTEMVIRVVRVEREALRQSNDNS